MPPNQITIDISELDDAIEDSVQDILLDIAADLTNELKKEAPTGATGDLQRMIQIWEREPGKITITMPDHAQWVVQETSGTGPGKSVPFTPIERWTRRKLGGGEDTAWAIWNKIDNEGTDADPFVSRALDTLEGQY